MDKIVRIDMGAAGGPRARLEAVGGYAGLGGRSMVSTVIWGEVPPECHPMGPANKLVLAPGMLAGSKAVLSGRLAMGCKSPLTGTLAKADTGGGAAAALGRLGYAAIIIEGRRVSADLWAVVIGPDGVRVERLDPYNKRMGGSIAVSGDGVAVVRAEPAGAPRRAGRRDVDAVMGLKGVARVVIDPGTAKARPPRDPERFTAASRRLAAGLRRRGVTWPGRTGGGSRHDCGPRCPGLPAAVADGGFDGAGLGTMDTAAALEDDAGWGGPAGRVGPNAASDILTCGGEVDPRSPDGRAEIARTLRIAAAALDSTGFCSRLGLALLDTPATFQALVDTIGAFTGLHLTGADLLALGRDTLRKERTFDQGAGLGPVHDRLPWFFRGDTAAPRPPVLRAPDGGLGRACGI